MDRVQLAAIASILIYFSAELWLRAPSAKPFRGSAFDERTTLLASSGNLASVILPSLSLGVFGTPDEGLGPLAVSIAFAVLALGAALRYWAMRVLGSFFTRSLVVQSGQTVIEAGPYRWVRHPGYLAALMVLPSFAVLLSGRMAVGILVLAMMSLIYAKRIPAEERMLLAQFGEAYEAYRSRTWRIVPGLV